MGGNECSSFGGEFYVCGGYSYNGHNSFSSSTYLAEGVSCYCGLKAMMLTSRIRKNPRRKFLRCPKYRQRDERCEFFLWVDCENCRELKYWLRILVVILVLSWVVFGVSFAKL